jgi:hypothetical protein
MKQSTQSVFMIRPHSFRMNEETAGNNHYQRAASPSASAQAIIVQAQFEFDGLVQALESAGVNVIVFDELEPFETPDALFPNNWISTHDDGTIGVFPMFAPNRRKERREDILIVLEHEFGFFVDEVLDFTEFEKHQKFLEGTGSLVLDRVHRKAYAALSERTDERAFLHFCTQFGYEPVAFTANQTVDGNRLPIYHTNVMMSVGSHFAAVCLDSIDDVDERTRVEMSLQNDGLNVIALTESQIENFAGNMLEIQGANELLVVMSSRAENALTDEQKKEINQHAKIVSAPLDTIENLGGGSARCVIAEIHLPSGSEHE